jgi:hypothetical protein
MESYIEDMQTVIIVLVIIAIIVFHFIVIPSQEDYMDFSDNDSCGSDRGDGGGGD